MSVLSALCQSYVAEAANALGVNPRTLARWSEDGKIKSIKTEAGQRRYDIAEYLKQKSGTTELVRPSTVLYARVSTSSQRDDLKRQTEALTTSYPGSEVITEIGSNSILGRESLTPFWNELSAAISNVLSLPTKTDLPDLASTSSNGCVKNSIVNSWFSTSKNTVHRQNSCKICCQSSTVSAQGFTDSVSTKNNSGKTRKYKSKKRHSQKLTAKLAPNSVKKFRVYPDSKLNSIWRHWLAGCPFVYNRCIEALKNGFRGSSYDLEAQILNDLPDWLKTVPRHPKANAVQDAYDALRQAKANNCEAKFRSCRQSVATIKFKNGNYTKGTWFPQLTFMVRL